MAREQRRLAAIIAADVVGYSRLMGRDESGTLARLREHRKERFEPALARHGGRLVKLTGDGALAEVPSAVDALGAAIEFQQAMAEANRDQPEDTRIVFRIGLHLGDLIVEGDDLYGDGVNVAARLEAQAPAGGIVISRTVHEAVAGRVKARFDDLGGLALKNIERPVQAFGVRWEPADWKASAPAPAALPVATLATADAPLALPDKPSIAVLPFQNMSGDPEQEYFADGMVEDIITALSRFKSLFVIARNSSFSYKGKSPDIRQVGRELGVRYVLEGSVRKAGTKVRITGQLIDITTGAHLWADRFDGALEEIFELQDHVATSVIGAIVPTVDRAEMARVKRKAVENPDAYDCYLRARMRINEPTSEGLMEALALCHRAIELDPGFSGPLGVAALAYSVRKSQGWVVDKAWEEAEVRRLASRVTQIDEDDAMALSAIGHAVAWVCRDFDMAATLIDRGLLINPNLAAAWAERAMVSIYLGQHETAIEQASRAIRLSPVDSRRWFAELMMSYALLMLGRYAEAIEFTHRGRTQRPKNTPLMLASAAAKALSGEIDQARTIALEAIRLNPSLRLSTLREYFVLRRPQDMERLIDGLRLAGLPE